MNVPIPAGWHLVPLNTPVEYHDLEWDRKERSFVFTKRFGDFNKRNRRKYVIRQDVVRGDLMRNLRYFPNHSQYGSFYGPNSLFHVAHILWLAGAQDVYHSVNSMLDPNNRQPFNTQSSAHAIVVEPYISLPLERNRPLLWYLLDKMKIFSGGGANPDGSDSYMQAYSRECDLSEIVRYFDMIRRSFIRVGASGYRHK